MASKWRGKILESFVYFHAHSILRRIFWEVGEGEDTIPTMRDTMSLTPTQVGFEEHLLSSDTIHSPSYIVSDEIEKHFFLAAGSARLVENNPSRSVVQWSLGLLDGWWPSSAPIALFINFCQSLTIKLMYWWCYLTTTWNSNSTALDLNHQREKHGAN